MRPPYRKIFPLALGISLAIVGCSNNQPKAVATLNRSAFLIGDLPANPLQWRVIATLIDQGESSMSTLYGNDTAVDYARTHARHDFPNGSTLSRVTWTQKEDERWYGAKTPDHVKSVEFVFVKTAADGHPLYSYQKYQGTPLKRSVAEEGSTPSEGASALLSQRAAVMP
jgi:Cytochrome P460